MTAQAAVKTHLVSNLDPEAKLYRKGDGQGDGQESRLCYMGHVLMENRNGLAVTGDVTQATGTAERLTALDLIDRYRQGARRVTLGADKGFDVEAFVEALRERKVTPHIAIDGHVTKIGKRRKTAVDGRTLRHPGYAVSQRIRKRIEEVFGWGKEIGGMRRTLLRGAGAEHQIALGLTVELVDGDAELDQPLGERHRSLQLLVDQ